MISRRGEQGAWRGADQVIEYHAGLQVIDQVAFARDGVEANSIRNIHRDPLR